MQGKHPIPGVSHTLAVASGKGGVGKTTVTVNLALGLQALGLRVGIFDADIFGPNVPLMLGVHRKAAYQGYVPVVRRSEARPYIPPLDRYGLRVMSMGLIVSEDQVINPSAEVAGQVVVRTLRDALWGELDILLIDLPPSADQPQQDLVAHIKMDGAVIVTTPQDLSLLDSSRSLQMYAQAGVPIIGLVENMSYFVCPHCGERHEIFQHTENWRPAVLNDAPLLGRIPLTAEISKGITREHPLMADASHTGAGQAQAEAFMGIARNVKDRLDQTLNHKEHEGR